MTRPAVVVAVAALGFGAAYFALATRLSPGTLEQPGAALFPLVIGVLLVASGAGFAGEVLRAGATPTTLSRAALSRVGAVTAALLGFCLAVPLAGYVATTFVLLVVTLRIFGLDRWPVAIALALVATAASWYGFAILLGVPVPRGVWGS